MPALIQVDNLSKAFRRHVKEAGLLGSLKGLFNRRYEETRAVDAISFSVEEGELVGFLGPNGAGKTTTLKMLSGLLHPSSGRAQVLGHTPWERKDAFRRQFALVMGNKSQLWFDIPAMDSLRLNKEIYGVSEQAFQASVGELAEMLEVQGQMNVPVRNLSLGERMKMELIASLLHRPRVLFLDEPTIGLDVVAKQQARELIKWLAREFGSTLILTTHDLKDITETCHRVILLDKGGLLFDGSIKAFESRFARERRVVAELERPLSPAATAKLKAKLRALKLRIAEWSGQRIALASNHSASLNKAAAALLASGAVAELDFERTEVEEIVRRIYTRQKPPATAGGHGR